MRLRFLLLALLGLASAAAAPIPAAVIADPPPDKEHPARFLPFALHSQGDVVNAVLYMPGGAGPNPTVILLHGLPGVENNVDLAQAIRRAGWNAMIFHYSGSWGSAGHFTFSHCVADGEAAVAWLRDPKTAADIPVDPRRIVIMGHSLGGWVAGYVGARDRGLMGVGLISAADFGDDITKVKRADAIESLRGNVLLDDGMRVLGDATPESVADDFLSHKGDWQLLHYIPGLAAHPLLVVTANDGERPFDDRIAAAVGGAKGAPVTTAHFDTNHGYNDHRIALAGAVVAWLQGLPDAPR